MCPDDGGHSHLWICTPRYTCDMGPSTTKQITKMNLNQKWQDKKLSQNLQVIFRSDQICLEKKVYAPHTVSILEKGCF